MNIKLRIKLKSLELKNPVMVASGTFGPEYGKLSRINTLGAYIAKTITLLPRVGNPPPRVAETPSGMLNSIGLENNGLEYFVKHKLPELKDVKIPVIASIAGDDENELKDIATSLRIAREISALEINLSCPNIKHGQRDFLIAQDADATYEAVKAVRKTTKLPVIAKLSPNVTDIARIALAAEDAGADAVSLVNTFIGMAVDIEKQKPVLGNITGGLSGPAIKPIALRMVREVYKRVKIPVIGIGGIMDYRDVIEFILCGATAVQFGTANFIDPTAAEGSINGLKKYMEKKGIKEIKSLIGGLKS